MPARLVVFYAKAEKASEGSRRHAWVQDGKSHRALCGRVPPRPVREPYRFPQPYGGLCAYCRDIIEPEPATPMAQDAAAGQANGVTIEAKSPESAEPA